MLICVCCYQEVILAVAAVRGWRHSHVQRVLFLLLDRLFEGLAERGLRVRRLVAALHEEEWHEHLEHALAVVHIMMPTVELYDPLSIQVQPFRVLQDRCSGDVTQHLIFKLPIAANFRLFGSEFLDVLFHFFAEEYFLDANKRSILERQFFVLKELVKVCAKLGLLELDEGV